MIEFANCPINACTIAIPCIENMLRETSVNCHKIADTLPEFQPQWTAQRGAQELHEAYQAVGLQPDEFEGSRYRRVHHIKHLINTGQLTNTLRWQAS